MYTKAGSLRKHVTFDRATARAESPSVCRGNRAVMRLAEATSSTSCGKAPLLRCCRKGCVVTQMSRRRFRRSAHCPRSASAMLRCILFF